MSFLPRHEAVPVTPARATPTGGTAPTGGRGYLRPIFLVATGSGNMHCTHGPAIILRLSVSPPRSWCPETGKAIR